MFQEIEERCYWHVGPCVGYQYCWNLAHVNSSNAEILSGIREEKDIAELQDGIFSTDDDMLAGRNKNSYQLSHLLPCKGMLGKLGGSWIGKILKATENRGGLVKTMNDEFF